MSISNFVTRARFAVAAGLFLGPVACTAIYDDTSTQCRSEDDCRGRGPDFADTTCSAERVCVKIQIDATLCSTNQDCTDRAGGSPSLCSKTSHSCVALTSAQCPRVLGDKSDLLDDNTIFLGTSFLPNIDGQPIEDAVEYARQTFKVASGGGLPSVVPGGPKRPIAVVSCPAEPTATGLSSLPDSLLALNHLSKEVATPVVIGPFFPGTSLAGEPQVLVPAKTMSYVLGSVSKVVSDYQTTDLTFIYRLAAIDTDSATLLPALLQNVLEPRVRTDAIAAPGEDVRVQVIAGAEATNSFSTQYVVQNIKWNGGKSAVDNGSNFRLTPAPDATDRINTPDFAAGVAAAINDARTFKPHIVIYITTPGVGMQLLAGLDSAWPMGVPKPLVVATLGSWVNSVVATIGTRETLRQRYYGLEPIPVGFDQARFDAYSVGLRLKFPELPSNLALQAGHGYDAFFLTAYAIVAAGASDISGTTISQALRKILQSGGPAISTGTDDLPRAFQALQNGGGLTVTGTTGPIAFDEKGNRKFNSRLYCVTGVSGKAVGINRPGYMIDSTTGMVSGTAVCP